MTRIYLDNAATSWPKPEAVYNSVDRYLRQLGAPAGRSAYREAAEVERLILDARKHIAGLMGVSDPRRIIFTLNGTDSLNHVLHGYLRAGDHVVTSVCEHNSVLRPLRELAGERGVEVTRVPCDAEGLVDPAAIEAALRPKTKLIALIHVSNVTGAIQPVAEVGRIAATRGLRFLVDAAQSLGHIPFAVEQLGAHFLAAPGHKGLLGPLGSGVLYIAPGAEQSLAPLRQGGTGTQSESDRQPDSLPDKYEAGNHNVPGIVGLSEGAADVAERGLPAIAEHEQMLAARFLAGLESLSGLRVYGPRDVRQRAGVVSLSIDGYDPQEVASLLDVSYSIQVRSGLHCAPLMHQALGTDVLGGTVRFSFGSFNTPEQVDVAIQALGEITSARM